MRERCIWSSIPSTDYVEDIMKENPGMKDDEALFIAYDQLADDRKILKDEFRDIKGHFIIYGSNGLWWGRQDGFTPFFDTTLGDAMLELSAPLRNCDSEVHVCLDGNGDITASKAHHDGTNYYKLRELDREYDEDELEEIASMPGGSEKWFTEHTRSCGHYVAERFGWND